MKLTSNSEEETAKLAKEIAKTIKRGALILLEGDLGTGKTLFTKYLLHTLGVPLNKTKSPTYTYVKTHKTDQLNIHHLDLYRIENEDPLLREEINEMIGDKENIVIIEWANKMPHLKTENPQSLQIKFEYLTPLKRKITINENI